jgi:predicted anti-sigma-YlaC factor YlaD
VIRCDELRELLSTYLEGTLGAADRSRVEDHLAACEECASTAEAMRLVVGAGQRLAGLAPSADLTARLTASPCARWLDLLFRAVDHEVAPEALARLLEHLERCEGCRRTWDDLALIQQVSATLRPPSRLIERCRTAHLRRPRGGRRVMGMRTATAAAYLLAVLTTLAVGNPVTLARYRALGTVQQASEIVSDSVNQVATSGRGELRVMIWRAWRWGKTQLESLKQLLEDQDSTQTPRSAADEQQGGTS